MKQFNLSEWLKDKSRKLCTRNGRPVRIICTDRKARSGNIVGLVGEDESLIYVWNNDGKHIVSEIPDNDLFFADEEKTNKILDELKSYLENTPKEQVEKDWKEIQDWYSQHFTNEKHNEKEELTEFEKEVFNLINFYGNEVEEATVTNAGVKEIASKLFDLARKEIEKDNSEFKPKFTYNEKDYSELGNKLIEFRNNTPLFSVSYRDGEGHKIILHYEKEITDLVKEEILKDSPKWKKYKGKLIGNGLIFKDNVNLVLVRNGYYIDINELDKLPKEE